VNGLERFHDEPVDVLRVGQWVAVATVAGACPVGEVVQVTTEKVVVNLVSFFHGYLMDDFVTVNAADIAFWAVAAPSDDPDADWDIGTLGRIQTVWKRTCARIARLEGLA
jgi:hypothetical protein